MKTTKKELSDIHKLANKLDFYDFCQSMNIELQSHPHQDDITQAKYDIGSENMEAVIEKQVELIEQLKELRNIYTRYGYVFVHYLSSEDFEKIKLIESKFVALEEDPTAVEITAEMDSVISELKKDFSGDDSYLSGVNDGMYSLYRKLVELK